MFADLNLQVLLHVFIVTRFILEQQEIEKKKNSKSRKKRKQNTDEEEGKSKTPALFVFFLNTGKNLCQLVCLNEHNLQKSMKEIPNVLFLPAKSPRLPEAMTDGADRSPWGAATRTSTENRCSCGHQELVLWNAELENVQDENFRRLLL